MPALGNRLGLYEILSPLGAALFQLKVEPGWDPLRETQLNDLFVEGLSEAPNGNWQPGMGSYSQPDLGVDLGGNKKTCGNHLSLRLPVVGVFTLNHRLVWLHIVALYAIVLLYG